MLSHSVRCGPPASFPTPSSSSFVPSNNTRMALAAPHLRPFFPSKNVLLARAGRKHGAGRHLVTASPPPSSQLPLGGRKVVSRSSRLDAVARIKARAADDSGAVAQPPGFSATAGLDPLLGKSGSMSFYGLTHQLVEEGKLMTSPHRDGMGSLVWVVGPLALISSLLLPQLFVSLVVEEALKDVILAEFVSSFSSEVIFYVGLAVFLFITDHVQRPYLEFSPKRWSLITGLKGYLSSAFFTMGFKVFAPLLAAYVAWPVIGLPAVVAVAPFLLGCAAQYVFEMRLDKQGSSCWPLLPIMFEVYRLYQLNRGAHFIERLLFTMRGSSMTPSLMERNNAFIFMLVVLQILGVVCLWSFTTFLLRLFPSRPVAEKY